MATKTFEELKQLAIQIRDEKTNKQNTATRIGTQMLEHLDKLEQDYYDKTATDEELKERDEKLTELDKLNSIDDTIIKCYNESICVFDGKIFFNNEGNLNLTASENFNYGHTKEIIPIPNGADMLIVSKSINENSSYIFTDKNDAYLSSFRVSDDREYITCPIPPKAKGFLCNAAKDKGLKLVFYKSDNIINIPSWNEEPTEELLAPYYSYKNNKLYIIMIKNMYSVEVSGSKNKIYKNGEHLYVWTDSGMKEITSNEELVKLKKEVNESLVDFNSLLTASSFFQTKFDSSIFSLNINPSDGLSNNFFLSCKRNCNGITSIEFVSWGLNTHCVFAAFDNNGNVIEDSKIFGKEQYNYIASKYEVQIKSNYDYYIVGHITNQSNLPEESEAYLIEYTSVKDSINNLNNKIDNLPINVIPEKIIDVQDFKVFQVEGIVKDYLNENGELVGTSGNTKVTDYIECSGYNQIECNLSSNNLVYCAFYLKDKTWFASFQTGAGSSSKRVHKVISIPNGVYYVRLTNITSKCTNPNAVLRKVSNWWENRKIAIYGTSVPAGYPFGCYEQQISEGKQDIYSFVNAAIRNIGATPLNYCVPSGAMRASKVDGTVNAPQYAFASDADLTPDFGDNGLQNVTYKNSMLSLIDTDNEPDLFLFSTFGTNDSAYDNTDFKDNYTPDYTSTEGNTFVGAFNKVLKALYESNPYARVAIMTTTRDSIGDNEYIKNANNQSVAIARLWAAPCMELHKMTGLVNNGIVDNRGQWIRDYDIIHPANFNRQKGVELIPKLTKMTEEWLKSIS